MSAGWEQRLDFSDFTAEADAWNDRMRSNHERHAGIPDFGWCPGRALGSGQRPEVWMVTAPVLEQQRADFALDGWEGRPWHFLAHARVARGGPWNRHMERQRVTPEDRQLQVLLPLPREWGVGHRDRELWCKALREGSNR